jgi:glycogen operon protein
VITVRAPAASLVELCVFDGTAETRLPMHRTGDDWTHPALPPGTRYGLRAHGEWAPERGLWFDPAKLVVDPHATELDQSFVQDPRLAQYGIDTAAIVPKAIARSHRAIDAEPPHFRRGGLIYELNVRGFTMLHPGVPETLRGTLAALAHPAVIAHLQRLHVSAVELMPIVAWIDERHLPPLGLANAWGYNPVVPMALDPRLCPGGVAELRETVAALHGAGIGIILDLVFNHTGESDVHGGVLSLRGLDARGYYAHEPDGRLINDTGCGNTLDFGQPAVRRLALDTMRHFVRHCGIDGFRFDLAPIMARSPGFDPAAPIFAEIAADPLLADRVLIAEPWDIGPGGYQLGQFPAGWLEWNDRFRDDVRRFWRGDVGVGVLATRLAGSSDLFPGTCRSVNFLAAHDGFTLADLVAYERRRNHANGEAGRDGHGENFSWNNGAEGPSDDPAVRAARAADLRALLGTLFASTGTIMLTAGDEFGRTQRGNNNAYAQDNETTWLDWTGRDRALEQFVAGMSARRSARLDHFEQLPEPGTWLALSGHPMNMADWESPRTDGFTYRADGHSFGVDRSRREAWFGD